VAGFVEVTFGPGIVFFPLPDVGMLILQLVVSLIQKKVSLCHQFLEGFHDFVGVIYPVVAKLNNFLRRERVLKNVKVKKHHQDLVGRLLRSYKGSGSGPAVVHLA
jgi:hypothetical protein